MMRELADEADRVGEDGQAAVAVERAAAQARVEGREEAVLGEACESLVRRLKSVDLPALV